MTSSIEPISVIIPALNEADRIGATIDSAVRAEDVEVIVADAGSSDATANVARKAGASVFVTRPGRAGQLNVGAERASGSLLVFLHADTRLPADYADHVRRILNREGVAGGAFQLEIEGDLPGLDLMAWGTNLRARRRQMPYGDQAIFLRKSTFQELGGFPDMPIMDDFVFIRQLRRRGRIVIAPAVVLTSGRRWKTVGVWKAFFLNQLIIVSYFLGVPPATLARWYRNASRKK